MTKRLIDANSFVLEDLLERDESNYLDTFADGVRAVMKAIRTAPTVDPIKVGCENCIRYQEVSGLLGKHCKDQDGYHYCTKLNMRCPDDSEFFCKYSCKR